MYRCLWTNVVHFPSYTHVNRIYYVLKNNNMIFDKSSRNKESLPYINLCILILTYTSDDKFN